MSIKQRKFFISELIWLDKNEPFYREAYQTQHFVPLTEDFNSRHKQAFSSQTVRNRLASYRLRKCRPKLIRGPIDLCTPEKTIVKIESKKFPVDYTKSGARVKSTLNESEESDKENSPLFDRLTKYLKEELEEKDKYEEEDTYYSELLNSFPGNI